MKEKGDEKRKKNKELHNSTPTNKQSEESLNASQEKFELAFKHSPIGICISNLRDGRFVEVNDVYSNFLGYSREELIGRTSSDINLWVDIAERDALVREIFQNGSVVGFELRFRDKNGQIHWGYTSAAPVKIGEESYLLTQTQDITEKKKIEEGFEKSQVEYRLLADNVTDAIFNMDINFNYTYASPSAYNIVGYTADELITMKVEQLVDSETLGWFAEMFAEEMEIEKRVDRDLKRSRVLEYQHVRKDGSKVWVETKLTFLRDENNTAVGMLGIVRDITERKRAEELLKQSEAQYRLLADNMKDQIWLLDLDLKLTYISPSVEKVSGYTTDEIKKLPLDKIITEASLKSALEVHSTEMSKALSSPPPLSYNRVFEFEFRHKDGHTFPVEATLSFIQDENGKPLYILGESRDITEQKKTEESLRQNEAKYRTILENMEEGYFETDLAGKITFINDASCKCFGYSKEELVGMDRQQLTDAENTKKLFQVFNKVYKTREPARNVSWQIIRKDGIGRYREGSISLKKDSSGKLIGFTAVAHDITEKKKAEENLRQSEEKYRLLADHMKDQVWIMDMNLKISYVSPSAEKLLGYSFEELRDLPLDKLLTAESLEKAMDFHQYELAKALAAPSDYVLNRSLELQFCCKDGHTVWGETMFSFIRDENGKALSILGEGRNITERKQMEDTLSKSEENFRHSLDDSPLGVRISTIEGKTLYANRAILDIYGYDSVEELENTPLQKRYTPETYAEFQIRKKKRLRGESGPSEYEVSIVRKNGEIGNLYVFRKEIFWNGKKQSQVIYQDITLRRQAEEKLSAILENLRQSIKITIQVLGTAAEARDPYMAGHQKRVADLARAIATEMKLPHDKIEAIRMAGAIHDIGKISIPSEILCKPAILSDLEFSFIKNHPQYSYDIIKDVESPWPLADIVHQHHERIDGSGYPQGLKNEEILIESRILAVADVVEAMVSYRPYRPALELEIALTEIENNAGILYDRNASDACLRLFREKGYQISS